MRDGAELDHKSGRAKVVERRLVALPACKQDRGLELRDGALAVGLPKWNEATPALIKLAT
jgi:hypothetical protein